MSTKEKSHKEQLTQDESISLKELFEPDESIKPHTLEDLFTPDEITEFFELKELFRQDDQFEQDGPIKLFRPDGKVVEIELDKLVPFGNHSFKLFQGRLLKDMINIVIISDWGMENASGLKKLPPIIVRPAGNGQYEILDGHYRVAAVRELESKYKLKSVKVPAIIKTGLTDEEALSYLTASNPIGLKLKHNIDIFQPNTYQNVENKPVFSIRDSSSMSLSEYIEHFLLDSDTIYDYESVYCMGNPCKLTKEECTDEAVASEISQIEGKESEGIVEDLVNRFTRAGGYIQQLNKYLGVDLDSFDYSDIQNRRERVKILFFIYTLKKRFTKVNILQMLSKPSMENIDNSFWGWETSNGEYIKYVHQEIEKEIAPALKANIKNSVVNIMNIWSQRMISKTSYITNFARMGLDTSIIINGITANLQKPFAYEGTTDCTFLPTTPLESLYLKLVQNEYLGHIYDSLKVYEKTLHADYPVPAEYMDAMRAFRKKRMSREDIEMYFTPENIREKAKYIYLKEDIGKGDRKRIQRCKKKVLRFLEFLKLTDLSGEHVMNDVTELLIISCLQVILLGDQNEIFEYNFHGFEGKPKERKGNLHVQAALKNDKRTYDVMKVYWIRMVRNRSAANIGDSKIREMTSKFQKMCLETLVKILKCSTVDEMRAMSKFYLTKLPE